MGAGGRYDSSASNNMYNSGLRLTLALGRTSKRHCVPVRPHFATTPSLSDIPYFIHGKVYNRRNHTRRGLRNAH
jgi:hypothetical protein